MRGIILAAGQGTRLRPLTNDRPKCMVEVDGKPIIERQLEVMRTCGIEDIIVVAGYQEQKIHFNKVKKIVNPKFEHTNMVATLMCAKKYFNDDLIVSYGDIVYSENVLNKLIDAEGAEIYVVVDRAWRKYWEARMENPLVDAETLKLDSDGYIRELGKVPKSYKEIEGQYIGLMKFSKKVIERVAEVYDELPAGGEYDGKDRDNMYMTSFLQILSKRVAPLKAVFIENGWMEVDTPSDLEYHTFLYK